jgi:hypothetical protein
MKKKYIGYLLLVGPILIGLLIALLSPQSVLAGSGLQVFVDISQFIFPTMAKMKGGYALEEVALLYFSFLWLSFPFLVAGGYLLIEWQSGKVLNSIRKNKIGSAMFAVVLFPLVAMVAATLNYESLDVNDFRSYSIYQTRLGMGLIGFWIPAGAAMLLAVSIFWWVHIVEILQD